MAAPAVLQRLQSRAAQAEQIINQLRSQLSLIRKTAVEEACKVEENKLAAENDELRKEVDRLREQLIQTEIRNGVPQVPLPNQGVSLAAPVKSVISAAPPMAAHAEASVEPPKKQAKKEKKEKKGGDGKPKNAPAASDKPVDVSRLSLKVGHIVSAKKHPDADGLYVEDVNLGEERNRTIISGLVKHIPLEQMQDRLAIFLTNLKPAKMRGILSEGMIMCASTPEKVEIIEPPPGAEIGDVVSVESYPGTPDDQLNPKKKVWEAVQPDLLINAEGLATYKGAPWMITSKGTCKAPSMTNVGIK